MSIQILLVFLNQTLIPYSSNLASKGANNTWLTLLVLILFPFLMCMYVCVYVCAHTYIHTYKHTYTIWKSKRVE